MSAGAAFHESRCAWVEEALAFVRLCVSLTPLREHSRLLERANGPGVPESCVLEALERFSADLARWSLELHSPSELCRRLQLAPNLQATFFYRLSHALYVNGVEFLPDLVGVVARTLSGMEIYYSAEIGPGLKVIHGVGTVIGARCRIGTRCTVYQGVTIGDKLGRQAGGRPVIGDDVILSAGAQVLGPVTVGSKTIIGANAVVISSLPGRCVAAGVPAQIKVANLSDEQFNEYVASIKG